jgi:hypothetical protein
MKTRLEETNHMRKLMGLPLLNEQNRSEPDGDEEEKYSIDFGPLVRSEPTELPGIEVVGRKYDLDDEKEKTRVEEINLKNELEELVYLADMAKEKKKSDKESLKSFLKGVKNNKKLSKKIASKQKELDKLEADLDKYKGPEHFKKHKKQIINKILTVIGVGIIGAFNLFNGEDKVNDALDSVREKFN